MMTQGPNEQEFRKPLWSFKTLFISFLLIVGLSVAVVLAVSRHELWLELEMVLGVIAVVMFGFYWWVLYHGVEFTDDEHFRPSFATYDAADPGLPDDSFIPDGADDPVSALVLIVVGLIIYLLITFGLSFLIWIGINSFVLAVALVAAPLFYVFRSSIKFVVRNSNSCRGRLIRAAIYSLLFTAGKTVLVGLVIAGAHYLSLMYKGS